MRRRLLTLIIATGFALAACDAVKLPGDDEEPAPAEEAPAEEAYEAPPPVEAVPDEPAPRPRTAPAPLPSSRTILPSNASTTSLEDCLASGGTDYTCIEIAYGTNRSPVYAGEADASVYGREYSGRPDCIGEHGQTSDGVCHLGVAVVTINAPEKRRRNTGTPFKYFSKTGQAPTERDRRNKMTIWQVGRFENDPRQEMIDYTRGVLDQLDPNDKHALVFIHGFNVPFEGSLYRAAQLKFDLDFAGPVFTFSWPSDANAQRYMADQDDADISAAALARFMRLVDDAVGPDTKVHVVAHSMGSRVTAQALARLEWERDIFGDVKPFTNTILAGGDIDRIYFGQLMESAGPVPGKVTIYTSAHDRAVECSQLIRDLFSGDSRREDPKARIGLHSDEYGRATSEAYDTIDISEFGSKWGFRCTNTDHADYAQEPEVFWDLSCVLAQEEPEGYLRQVFLDGPREDNVSGGNYWLLEPGRVPENRTCAVTRAGVIPDE